MTLFLHYENQMVIVLPYSPKLQLTTVRHFIMYNLDRRLPTDNLYQSNKNKHGGRPTASKREKKEPKFLVESVTLDVSFQSDFGRGYGGSQVNTW